MITNSNNKLLKRSWTRNSLSSVSRELGVDEGVLHNWKKLKLESSSNLERENLELKKRLREVELERDILSDPLRGIFGRGSWSVTGSLKIIAISFRSI